MPNVQRKTPDDGQRNCPKHVEFLDKNKFEKLVRLLVLLKRCLEGFKLEYMIYGTCGIVKDKTTSLSARIYKTVVHPPGIHFS